MKKSKILVVLGVLLLSTTLVSAALLPYFGKVTTTMNVQQSIVIGEPGPGPVGITWHNWNEPIARDLGDVIHCTDYCYKLLIKNQACEAATATITDVATAYPGSGPEGVSISHHIFGDSQMIELRYKDAQWNVINAENMGADITFNTCGSTFDYSIKYWGLEGVYSLVYYIDQDPRFEVWGKVFVIDGMEFDGSGTVSGSKDIATMPYADDWNAGNTGAYPDYEHTSGAKFWLVPTENILDGQLISWTPGCYLFETDLALYIDCDDWTPYCLPYVFPQFDTNILLPLSTYCWISCYHVDFNIMPGHYAFETLLTAVPVVI
jgi:hypothetical protein